MLYQPEFCFCVMCRLCFPRRFLLIRRWDWSAFWLEMIGWVSGRGIVGGLGARKAGVVDSSTGYGQGQRRAWLIVVDSSTGYGQGQIQVRVTGSRSFFLAKRIHVIKDQGGPKTKESAKEELSFSVEEASSEKEIVVAAPTRPRNFLGRQQLDLMSPPNKEGKIIIITLYIETCS